MKLRDFESAVNNFEKALERAKLVHNNEAQQAIINVSLSLWGWGEAGPGTLSPRCLFPLNRRAPARQGSGFPVFVVAISLYSNPTNTHAVNFVVLATLHSNLRDLSSPTRDRTHTHCSRSQHPNYWTAREFPSIHIVLFEKTEEK